MTGLSFIIIVIIIFFKFLCISQRPFFFICNDTTRYKPPLHLFIFYFLFFIFSALYTQRFLQKKKK